ncbi:MAG: DNA primase DnaG [Thermofilum sp.]|uniref:DNA primase DnaG n=1 Tax=Thermofilum pendens TaxID=2269 RepID=A0A7C4D261_THEPE
MGGPPVSAKYVIKARIEVAGLVEKHDIIGAIFGQTEGLLGDEMDFRELQRTGRIGRIEASVKTTGDKTIAEVEVPSNLDMVETAILAATIETIDKVGPYSAKAEITGIEDVRSEKRRRVVERAVEIYRKMLESIPESRELVDEVLSKVRAAEVVEYGEERLPGGPDVTRADTVILVEGRADVINLLRHGYRNVLAVGGATTVPPSLKEIIQGKKTILFVDGDRGGEMIARNLLNAIKIDYVARAPEGKEVEDLTAKEIARCIQSKVSAEEFLESLEGERRQQREVRAEFIVPPAKLLSRSSAPAQPEYVESVSVPRSVKSVIEELKGTLEAVLYDENWAEITRVPVKDLVNTIKQVDGVSYVVLDGIVTQRLVDAAYTKGVKALIGVRVGEVVRKPENLKISTFDKVSVAEDAAISG